LTQLQVELFQCVLQKGCSPHRILAGLHASAIVTFISRGATAARIACKRPKAAILAITPDPQVSASEMDIHA
jgi:pyruvate kinase